MNKKNIKPLVLSSLAALSLGSMSVAGTFALFTDTAETTINIGAAEVNVKNAMTIVDAYSLNQQDANTHTTKEAHYVNGGEVEVTDNTAGETTQIDVVNWTPGDGVKLRTAPTNSSNVTIKVRLKAVMSGLLAPALVMEVRNAEATGDALYAAKGSRTLVSDWVDVDPGANPAAFDLDIKFPNHGFEITAREEGIDNQYQGKPATIKISYEAVQGNADVSANLLERINTKLATNEVKEGKNANMFEAVNDLGVVATLAQIKENSYVWGADEDLFYEAAGVTPGQEYKYFKVYEAANVPAKADQTFSIYADGSGWTSLELKGVGFDAGSVEGMTAVSYEGAASARENIIRTNGGTLTINASQDIIHHYGDTNYINIIAVAGSSYHENGNVGIVEISNGRLVLEKESEVARIHLSKSVVATEEVFNDITIAKDSSVEMPVFSRDPIEIPEEGKLVVALQDGTKADEDKDYVWLTAIGVYEQVVVSDQKESLAAEDAKNSYAAESGSDEQKDAAQQIANNISVQIGEDKYEVKAERNTQGKWEYKLEGETEEKTEAVAEYEVTVKETVQEQTQTVVQEVVVKNGDNVVESTPTIENGVTAEEIAKDIQKTSNGVARIGSTRYGSLQDAFDAVQNGQTIIVLKDIDLGVKTDTPLKTIAGTTFTLDLNGHVVSSCVNGADTKVLLNKAAMTLIDSSASKTGAISNSSITGNNDCTATISNGSGSSLTINGAKVTSQTGQAIRNFSDLTLNSGAVVKTTGTYSGNYSNGACAIDIRATGSLVVRDGAQVYSENGLNMYVFSGADVEISGGDFHCYTPRGLFGGPGANNIAVTGGTYNYKPTAFLAYSYGAVEEDGIYTVKPAVIQNVFVDNLDDLKAAAASAGPLAPTTITLTSSIDIAESVALSENVTLEINTGVTVSVKGNGVLINDGYINNEGTISVTENGFLSNPLNITGDGELTGYDSPDEDDNYGIYNAMDLQWLAVLNSGYDADFLYVTLENDITVPEGVTFQSIPFFAGEFDGAYHTISGIVINSAASFTGLFTGLAYATIKNLTIIENVTALSGTTGGIAGYINAGETFFENVTVSGSITVNGSSYGTGGFVGQIGGTDSSEVIHFVECENKAIIYAPNASIVGGFFGTATANQSPVYFINCTNSGNITSGGYGATVGGYLAASYSTGRTYLYGYSNNENCSVSGVYTLGVYIDDVMVFGASGYNSIYDSAEYDYTALENGAFEFSHK